MSIEKQFGKGSIMCLGNKEAALKDTPAISTGALSLDLALGIGGLPRGRIVEIYGPESSGKTTLALSVAAQAQKQKGIVAFVDAEHALDISYAQKLGVPNKGPSRFSARHGRAGFGNHRNPCTLQRH